MLKRHAEEDTETNGQPMAKQRRLSKPESREPILSILEVFLPDVLACMTREYLGVDGQTVKELKEMKISSSLWFPPVLLVDGAQVAVGTTEDTIALWDLSRPWEPRRECVLPLGRDVVAIRSGYLFQLKSHHIAVYDLSGQLLQKITYPPNIRLEHIKGITVPRQYGIDQMVLHMDQILLRIDQSEIRALDVQNGNQIRAFHLPKGDRHIASVQRRLYSTNPEDACIHEINDQDGSCIRTITMNHDKHGVALRQIAVMGEMYDELYVLVDTYAEGRHGRSYVHVYSLSTGQFLRRMMEDAAAFSLLPNGYALACMSKNERRSVFLVQ